MLLILGFSFQVSGLRFQILGLGVSFKLKYCLDFYNHDSQKTNYELYIYQNLHCTCYTLHHTFKSSVPKKQAKVDNLCDKLVVTGFLVYNENKTKLGSLVGRVNKNYRNPYIHCYV